MSGGQVSAEPGGGFFAVGEFSRRSIVTRRLVTSAPWPKETITPSYSSDAARPYAVYAGMVVGSCRVAAMRPARSWIWASSASGS